MQQQAQTQELKSLAFSIAHEVKNPLSAIKTCCQMISDNMKENIELLDLIFSVSNRGLLMTDIILQNIRDGQINKDNFINLSMSHTINKAIKEYSFDSAEENFLITLNLDNDFTFKGDENLMIFVLFNLLKNSLYHKAKINVSLARDHSFNYLHFKDTGIGIEKNKLELIFESFMTSNKKNGTGLGLSFCKRVMIAFNGKINCNSELGKYTEFVLSFPKIKN